MASIQGKARLTRRPQQSSNDSDGYATLFAPYSTTLERFSGHDADDEFGKTVLILFQFTTDLVDGAIGHSYSRPRPMA